MHESPTRSVPPSQELLKRKPAPIETGNEENKELERMKAGIEALRVEKKR